jgi:lysophospholipase L1-like esterase
MPRFIPGASAGLRLVLFAALVLATSFLLFGGLGAQQRRARAWQLGRDALILAGIALALEGLLRVALFRQGNILRSKEGIYYFGAEPLVSSGPFGDLPPGESVWLISTQRPYTVVVNRQGLRHVEDVAEHAVRILALGDSFTFGPYVANEDTWPALLEAELRNADPTRPVQVLNAGIAGYGVAQELDYLKEKGLALRPALVLLAFYPNDINEVQPERQQLFQRPTRKSWDALAWLTRRSVLFHELRSVIVARMFQQARKRAVAVRDAAPKDVQEEAHYQGYRQAFLELVSLLREAGVPLLVVAFPEAGQVPPDACPEAAQRFVERLAREAGVPYLDLLPHFRRHRIDELYLLRYDAARPPVSDGCFPDRERYVGNGHLARFGYQVAARAIVQRLLASDLIPPRSVLAEMP